jgi:hypothetical protein
MTSPHIGTSDERAFRTKPLPGYPNAKFIMYADQDWDDPSPGSPTTAALALRDVMDGYDAFLLHPGAIILTFDLLWSLQSHCIR